MMTLPADQTWRSRMSFLLRIGHFLEDISNGVQDRLEGAATGLHRGGLFGAPTAATSEGKARKAIGKADVTRSDQFRADVDGS